MEGFAGRTQDRIGRSSVDLVNFTVKMFTGLVLGSTFGLVVLELLRFPKGEGTLSFIFSLIVVMGLFWRLARSWSLTSVLVFDLLAVLVALLLRMYVVVAPNL